MSSLGEALGLVFAMGAVILFCRAFPFLFFDRGPGEEKAADSLSTTFIGFVEKIVPPVAMTVLAFNALGGAFRGGSREGFIGSIEGLLALGAAVFTALLHLWKRNALISIFWGTALYMILMRIIA